MAPVPKDEPEHGPREQAAMLRGLLDAAPIGIGLVKDRILGWTNRQFEELIGYTNGELAGHSARILYPDEEEYERVGRIKHTQVAARGQGSVETRMRRKDGAIIDVLLSSAALDPGDPGAGLVFTVLDITERRRAESVLRERDRSAAALFANLPGMVYRCRNDESWTMDFLSERCLEYTGYPAAALLGNAEIAYADLIHPADRARVYAETQAALDRREPFELEYRVVLPERGERWFRERGCGLFVEDGDLSAIEGFITDITDYKQLLGQSLQSSKLEAIGQLAGGIAHDFNNLLQVINGYTALLIEDLAAGRPDPAHLAEIRKAGQRAESLVGQLLAFSRRQVLHPRDLDLNELGDNLFTMIRRMLGEHIAFTFTKDPTIGPVHSDPAQLEQVLMNLAINARDAMPDGGSLAVRTQAIALTAEECVHLPGARPGPHVLLTVSDTGEGMDESVLAQIFEPFFTTKEVGRGTGLGLSTVYGIVQQHGGAIVVASQPGAGTTFSIYLPVAGGAAAAAAERTGATVLIADPDEATRRATRRLLEKSGYTVLSARVAAEVLEMVQRHAATIDLIVWDLALGGAGDPAVRDLLDAATAVPPILFCAGADGQAAPPGRRHALLRKPFTPDALQHRITALLAARTAGS